MRTPWREALDGKIKVLRDLSSTIATEAMKQYFLESASLERAVGPSGVKRAVDSLGPTYVKVIQTGVRRAEPFWVWDSIANGVADRMTAGIVADEPFAITDLPVTEGLLWFQQPVKIATADKGEDSAWVRAIFFGIAHVASLGADNKLAVEEKSDCMGVVAFLDSARSGFVRASDRRDFLMPWICNAITEGTTLTQYAGQVTSNTPDLERLDLAMSVWPTAFCLEFFRLLKQKLLLYGGSGLERDARREAQRHGLEPVVRVVEWRKAEYRYPEGHIPAQVNWSCQWVVQPHLRRYKSGKVVQVKAYTKGPKDKPLKAVDQRVNVVKR